MAKDKPSANVADITITTNPDRDLEDAPPGTYVLYVVDEKTTHITAVTIEKLADGTRRTLKVEPLAIPMHDATSSTPALGHAVSREGFEPVAVALGKPLPPSFGPVATDGNRVDIGVNGVCLCTFYKEPTAKEIDAIAGMGRVQVRLLTRPHTMLVLFKFGSLPWCEGIFNVHIVPEEARVVPAAPSEGYGWMLHLILVDSATGLVRGLRRLSLTRKFSLALLNTYNAQLARAPDYKEHQAEVRRLQRHSSERLAAEAMDRFEQGKTAD